jgi:tRNA threonylcarbamoyl adenosine modification protein YeaZ
MQSEFLLVMIESILKECNLKYENLDYIATTNGPGSFTGIRIGLAAICGIIAAKQNLKPIIYSNFDIWRYRAIKQIKDYSKIITIIDANRNELYINIWQENTQKNGLIRRLFCNKKVTEAQKNKLIKINEFEKFIRSEIEEGKNIFVIGDGIGKIYKKINGVTFLPRFNRIKAKDICSLIGLKMRTNNLDIKKEILPLYIRKPDAVKPKN